MKIIRAISRYYCQSSQDTSITFSPVVRSTEGNYHQLWAPVRCRDKLQDLPIILASNGEIEIPYINGFNWMPGSAEHKLLSYQGATLLLHLEYSEYNDSLAFRNKLDLVNSLERELNLRETSIVFNENNKSFIIEGDLFWAKSPYTLSFYTFFLRSISYPFYNDGVYDTLDEIFKDMEDRWSEDDDYGNRLYEGEEDNFARGLLDKKLGYKEILKNIDFILGDNPLTGVNDKEILRVFKEKKGYTNLPISATISIKQYTIDFNRQYSLTTQHCYSGFCSVTYDNHFCSNQFVEWLVNLKILKDKKYCKESISQTLIALLGSVGKFQIY